MSITHAVNCIFPIITKRIFPCCDPDQTSWAQTEPRNNSLQLSHLWPWRSARFNPTCRATVYTACLQTSWVPQEGAHIILPKTVGISTCRKSTWYFHSNQNPSVNVFWPWGEKASSMFRLHTIAEILQCGFNWMESGRRLCINFPKSAFTVCLLHMHTRCQLEEHFGFSITPSRPVTLLEMDLLVTNPELLLAQVSYWDTWSQPQPASLSLPQYLSLSSPACFHIRLRSHNHSNTALSKGTVDIKL